MDGRWKRWACAGLIAGAVGCNRNAVQQPPAPGLPFNQDKPSLLERTFGARPSFTPQAPEVPEPVVRDARDPDAPPGPEFFVALGDTFAGAAFMEGKSAVERDQLIDNSRRHYQTALKGDPGHKGALLGLAKLYARCGDKERMAAAFQAALKHSPKDHDLAHKMAAAQVQVEDYAGAAQSCAYALSLDPENRTYLRTLGYCQAKTGQWQQAGETLMRVMPEAKARYFLGRVLIDQDRLAEGRQMIQMAAAQDPELQAARDFLTELDAGRPTGGVQQAVFDGATHGAAPARPAPGTGPAHER